MAERYSRSWRHNCGLACGRRRSRPSMCCTRTLSQRGIACTVVEARPAGIEKACGEGLMPDSREVLAKLGVPLDESDGHLFQGIRFENSAAHVEARFSRDAGIGVRRPHLHRLLSERARQVGARLLWNTRIQLPEAVAPDSSGYRSALVNGQPMRFRWLIGDRKSVV